MVRESLVEFLRVNFVSRIDHTEWSFRVNEMEQVLFSEGTSKTSLGLIVPGVHHLLFEGEARNSRLTGHEARYQVRG